MVAVAVAFAVGVALPGGAWGQQSTTPDLSKIPQLTATVRTPAPTPPNTTTARRLPNTGLDVSTLALVGGALLLLGIGLRLRTARMRF